LPPPAEMPKLSKRLEEIWALVQARQELPLQELLVAAKTTGDTVRRLEDKGLIAIAKQISERDPYARETILPSQALELNPEQKAALSEIIAAVDGRTHTSSPNK